MKHLYQKIYLTVIVSLLLVVFGAGVLWRFATDQPRTRQAFEVAGELTATALPPLEASTEAQKNAIVKLAGRLKIDLALFDSNGTLVAASARGLPSPRLTVKLADGFMGPAGPPQSFVYPMGDGCQPELGVGISIQLLD